MHHKHQKTSPGDFCLSSFTVDLNGGSVNALQSCTLESNSWLIQADIHSVGKKAELEHVHIEIIAQKLQEQYGMNKHLSFYIK